MGDAAAIWIFVAACWVTRVIGYPVSFLQVRVLFHGCFFGPTSQARHLTARHGCSACATNGVVYVLGGADVAGPGMLSDGAMEQKTRLIMVILHRQNQFEGFKLKAVETKMTKQVHAFEDCSAQSVSSLALG